MSVKVGSVPTFAYVNIETKDQALKVCEEAAELFSAWETWSTGKSKDTYFAMIDEACDVIQATCNLLRAAHVADATYFMQQCRERNEAKGREYWP